MQKMLKEGKAETNKEPQEIQWRAIHPYKAIKEGECPICRGERHLIAFINGNLYSKRCSCFEKEIAMQQLQKTGIAESIEKYTFESFQITEQ